MALLHNTCGFILHVHNTCTCTGQSVCVVCVMIGRAIEVSQELKHAWNFGIGSGTRH